MKMVTKVLRERILWMRDGTGRRGALGVEERSRLVSVSVADLWVWLEC